MTVVIREELTPGEQLYEIHIRSQGKTLSQFAKEIDISITNLHNIVRRNQPISKKVSEGIAIATNQSKDLWHDISQKYIQSQNPTKYIFLKDGTLNPNISTKGLQYTNTHTGQWMPHKIREALIRLFTIGTPVRLWMNVEGIPPHIAKTALKYHDEYLTDNEVHLYIDVPKRSILTMLDQIEQKSGTISLHNFESLDKQAKQTPDMVKAEIYLSKTDVDDTDWFVKKVKETKPKKAYVFIY